METLSRVGRFVEVKAVGRVGTKAREFSGANGVRMPIWEPIV